MRSQTSTLRGSRQAGSSSRLWWTLVLLAGLVVAAPTEGRAQCRTCFAYVDEEYGFVYHVFSWFGYADAASGSAADDQGELPRRKLRGPLVPERALSEIPGFGAPFGIAGPTAQIAVDEGVSFGDEGGLFRCNGDGGCHEYEAPNRCSQNHSWCTGDFGAPHVAEQLQRAFAAPTVANVAAVLRALGKHAEVNTARSALQLVDCDGSRIVASLPLAPKVVAALQRGRRSRG